MSNIRWAEVFETLGARRELPAALVRGVLEEMMSGACGEAEAAAFLIGLRMKGETAGEIAVCSTGLIGVTLPMDKLLPGVETAADRLSEHGGEKAAIAYIPTVRERVLNSADAREGIQSFIERRAAVFQGR